MNKKILGGGLAAVVLVIGAVAVLSARQDAPTSIDMKAEPHETPDTMLREDVQQETMPVPEPVVITPSTDVPASGVNPAPSNVTNDDRSGTGGPFSTPTDRRRGADKPED